MFQLHPPHFLFVLWGIVSAGCAAHPPHPAQFIHFDGETYTSVAHTQKDKMEITKFIQEGESLHTWNQMITVQAYPTFDRVENVMEQFDQLPKPIPRGLFIQRLKTSPYKEDFIMELQPHYQDEDGKMEMVLVRAFSNLRAPVMLYIFTHRYTFGGNWQVDIEGQDEWFAKRDSWLQALKTITIHPASQ